MLAIGAFFVTAAALLLFAEPDTPAAANSARVVNEPLRRADPDWIDINRPFHMFDLSGSPYLKLPLGYSARRDANGSARQDILTYGPATLPGSFFRAVLYRRGDEIARPTSLFVEAARAAALSGLSVIRSGLPAPLPTRFGLFEVAEVSTVGGGPGTCLGFRRVDGRPDDPLAITGLACSPDPTFVRKSLACAIDRLELVSAGDDEPLRRFFVAAEQKRGLGCTSFVTDELSAVVFPLSLKHLDGNEAN